MQFSTFRDISEPFSSLREGMSCVVINGRIFLGLGWSQDYLEAKVDWYEFDLNKMELVAKAPVPSPIGIIAAGSFVIGNFAYIIAGGYQNTNWRYDALNDTWASMAVLPKVCFAPMCATDGTNGYAGLGSTGGLGTDDKKWYRYNVGADTWTALTDYPIATPPLGNFCVYKSGFIYALSDVTGQAYKYSIAGNSWTAIANATPINGLFVFSQYPGKTCIEINGKVYMFSGRNNPPNTVTDLYIYDIAGNSWATQSAILSSVANGARYDGCLVESNGFVLYIAGWAGTGVGVPPTLRAVMDFGLRVQKEDQLMIVQCENPSSLASPLRICTDGVTVGIPLFSTDRDTDDTVGINLSHDGEVKTLIGVEA